MLFDKPLCFVDIETTGGRVTSDRIIEIGILKVIDNEIVDTYETLINPQTYISPFISNITGITSFDVEDAPTFDAIYKDVYEFLGDSIFVAHNARFDYGFIRQEFSRQEISFSSPLLCTVRLSRLLYPRYKRHNLDSIIERFNITYERRHRALDDAKIMFKFFNQARQSFPTEKVQKAINTILKKPSLPTQVSNSVLDDLPQSPGVYIFYGDSDVPLYIGKSTNIRNRVMSHFTSDHESTKEMTIAQQLKRIETIPTAGELGALLKESQLIKDVQPLYNRQLRLKKEITAIVKVNDGQGYNRAEIRNVSEIQLSELDKILAICKTKKQAKELLANVCKEFGLCEKLLGLTKGPGACFSYKLGICKGACIGEAKKLPYNIRFLQGFSKTKVKQWPFKGAIKIAEESIAGEKEYFIVDNWCLLGSIKEHDDLESYQKQLFDYDTYKILARFIFDSKNQHKISVFKLPATNY